METIDMESKTFSDLPFSVARMFSYIKRQMGLSSNAQLARVIHVRPETVRKAIRGNYLTAYILIRSSEASGIPTKDLRYIAGDRRFHHRRDQDDKRNFFDAIRKSKTVDISYAGSGTDSKDSEGC